MPEGNKESTQGEYSDYPDSDSKEVKNITPEKFEFPISEKETRSLADELDIRREDTRSNLASILIWILVVTYIGAFATMLFVLYSPLAENEIKIERYTYSKDILSLLISTQTGLIGAVLGFYFGSSRNKG